MAKNARESDRGEATRQRLIAAGLSLFARYGYEGVSTRALAKAAKVNLGAIPYHFGGKEGVYIAVVEELAAAVGPTLHAMAGEIEGELAGAGRAETEALLARFIETMARTVLGGRDLALRARFMLREQLDPTPAFDRLYESFIAPVHGCATRLVGRLLGLDPADPDTILRAHALLGQILAFAVARATVRRRLGWREEYTGEQIDAIARTVVELSLAALGGRPKA
jgi:AcrR family transcriptional regulator